MQRPDEICRSCGGHAGFCPCEDKEGCAHESWEEYPPPGQRRPGQGFSRKCADCKQVLKLGREPVDPFKEGSGVPFPEVVCACGHVDIVHMGEVAKCTAEDCECTSLHEVLPLDDGRCHMCWDDPCACREESDAPAEPEPRPMQAVAYGIGGQLYELMTHPDAIVRVENGVLTIQHADGTPAIVQVRTVRVQ